MTERKIPEPPDANTSSPEELAAYYEKYDTQELIDARYAKILPKDDPGSQRRKKMAKDALKKF
jgi:hypothetical protein